MNGIHLIHLNINTLLPEIDEIRYIAARPNATVFAISEFKLDQTIFSRKSKYLTMSCSDMIETETAEVLLAILEVISVTYKNTFFRRKSKILMVQTLLTKTKPLIVGIIYRPTN